MFLKVSDHAVLRFMQRLLKVPVEEIRDQIKNEVIQLFPVGIPKGRSIRIHEGISYVIDNCTLLTVYTNKKKHQTIKRPRRA